MRLGFRPREGDADHRRSESANPFGDALIYYSMLNTSHPPAYRSLSFYNLIGDIERSKEIERVEMVCEANTRCERQNKVHNKLFCS